MAAAGSKARAACSNIGDRILRHAASRCSPSATASRPGEKMFPQAVQDVLAGVQFIRGKAAAFGIDPARIESSDRRLRRLDTSRRWQRWAAKNFLAAIRRIPSPQSIPA